jgi:NAD-dependent deacetylase
MDDSQAVQLAADLLKQAHYTVVLTGAGFSTPSGIPDFRSAGSGLWTRFLPMEVASLSSFRYDPERFFAWLHPLASHMLDARPNPAHLALAQLEQAGRVQAVITQNIDGLHQRAGSKKVYEIHGTLNTLTCIGCFKQHYSEDLIAPYLETGAIPRCPDCNRILKPDVILFEEQLPVRTWLSAQKVTQQCDLMLIAGTSLEVMPSAVLPVRALDGGAKLIIINQGETYIDVRADVLIRTNVAEVLPALAGKILGD